MQFRCSLSLSFSPDINCPWWPTTKIRLLTVNFWWELWAFSHLSLTNSSSDSTFSLSRCIFAIWFCRNSILSCSFSVSSWKLSLSFCSRCIIICKRILLLMLPVFVVDTSVKYDPRPCFCYHLLLPELSRTYPATGRLPIESFPVLSASLSIGRALCPVGFASFRNRSSAFPFPFASIWNRIVPP